MANSASLPPKRLPQILGHVAPHPAHPPAGEGRVAVRTHDRYSRRRHRLTSANRTVRRHSQASSGIIRRLLGSGNCVLSRLRSGSGGLLSRLHSGLYCMLNSLRPTSLHCLLNSLRPTSLHCLLNCLRPTGLLLVSATLRYPFRMPKPFTYSLTSLEASVASVDPIRLSVLR